MSVATDGLLEDDQGCESNRRAASREYLALQQSAYLLALESLKAEFPSCSDDPRLREVVISAVVTFMHFGQSDRQTLALYATTHGRAFVLGT